MRRPGQKERGLSKFGRTMFQAERSVPTKTEAELGYSTRALTNIAVFKGVDLLLRVFSISKTVPRKLLLFDDSSSFLECSVYKAFLPLTDIGRKKNNLL